jgi:hypothetical protein
MFPMEANKIHQEYSSFMPNMYNLVKDLFVFTPKDTADQEAVAQGQGTEEEPFYSDQIGIE